MSRLRRVLAIDTTSEHGSIALADEGGVVEELVIHSPEGFGHVVFGEIEALLARHKWPIEDIDLFAAASGPGSFTGVRVGLTAAMGLAEATGHHALGISNLKALASFGTAQLRAPVIDARRGEIYGAVYDARLRPVQDEVVTKLSCWLSSLPKGDLDLITFGLPENLISEIGARHVIQAPALAGALALIALRENPTGTNVIDANYVRRSDAELFWKDPGGG